MNLRRLSLAVAGAVSISSAAFADDFFNFNWTDTTFGADGGASAIGVFDTTDNGNGTFTVVGVSGAQTLGGTTQSITALSSFGSADQILNENIGSQPLSFSGISYHAGALGDFNVAYDNGLVRISSSEEPDGYAAGEHSISFAATPVTGGVPEPASWALMILGFGGVGSMLRRKKLALA